MASFFGLSRPRFRPGRMSRVTLKDNVAAGVEHMHPARIRRRPNAQWLHRVLCATAVLLLATTASASTLTVTNSSDSISSPATGSLRAALTSAMPGDTINIAVTGTITLAGPLPAIAEDLTITGPGASSLTISGSPLSGVFTISSGTVSISGLTIADANNQSAPGGAISNGGALTVANVVFNQNDAISAGGAIYNTGTLTVSGSTFSNDRTIGSSSGGAIWSSGTLTVSNSIFSGNISSQAGSIENTGTLRISNSIFSGNSGSTNGGAILNSSGANTATVTDSFFLNNSVSTAPQGLAADFTGGAIQNNGGTLIVSNSTFVGNSAPAGEGGAIANGATLTLSNNTFVGNTSTGGAGGAIVNSGGTLTLNNSILSGNGSGTGAGVDQTGGTVDANYNVFYQNLDTGGDEGDCVNCSSNLGAINANPQLAPLGNYGGTTETMLPLPGSPTICAGSYSLATSGTTQLTTDQRGFPLAAANCSNSGVDIGAVQTNYLMVNTTADSSDASCGATCSLRDAIQQADSAGMQDIAFASSAVGTITLGSTLPALSGVINIAGPGAANLTVSGGGSATVGSVLTVDSTAQIFLSSLTVANGNANSGGGILNKGTLTVTNSAFTGNSTPGTLGGAIDNSGTLTVANSTFSGNSSGNSGGAGGAIDNSGTLAVANSTFSGNSSGSDGGVGGALYDTGTLTVSNSTFVGNSSANGGAVAVFGGTATIANSIFAHNTSASKGAAVFTPSFVVDAYNNLFFANLDTATSSESDCFNCTINSGSVSGDPMLAALGNYGGTTQTLLPLPGSAAICAGLKSRALDANGNPLTTDQRGFALGASSSTYCSAITVDAGAVQTDYTSIQFTNIPGGGAYPAIQNAVPNPLPIVSVTENSQNIGSVPVTLTDASHTVTGLGPATTAANTGATFSSLKDSAIEDTTLSATLPITSAYSLTTATTAAFEVTTSTLTLTPATLPSPTVEVAYSQTLSASGGSGTYTYALTSGALPAGLMLSPSGAISGTPTTTTLFSFTVTATDSNNSSLTGSQAYTLTVVVPTITLTPTTLPSPTVGVSYSHTVSATGGVSPYAYSISAGALPAGLTLSSSTGVISGTATGVGIFNFTVKAEDTNSFTATQTYSFAIAAPTITLMPASGTLNAMAETAYSQTFTASGGTSPYTYSISAGALPAGLTLSSTTGVISGTPTASGTFSFTVKAVDSSTSTGSPFFTANNYTLFVATPTITLTPATLPSPTIEVAYSHTVSAAGGVSPYAYSISAGALPSGITLSSTTGVISGTVTASGTFSFTITAKDTNSFTTAQAYSFTIAAPAITLMPTTLPSPAVGVAYSQTLSTSGGTSPYTYSISAGALPAGLTLSSTTGVISGTVTASGTFSFTVTTKDTNSFTAAQAYSFTIAAPTVTLMPTTLPSPTVGVAYSQTLNASGGTSPYTYSITAGALPTGLTLSTTGVISGTATAANMFSFTVTAKDSDGFTATQSYPIMVSRQASQTTVSASPSVASPTQTVTLTAVVSATVAGTFVVPTGTVTFLDNGTQVGTAAPSGGTATLVVPSLPAGATAVITATYAGDGNFLASTSSNSATVVVSAFNFTFTNTGTAAYTAAPGAVASYNFALAPLYGSYAGTVSFSVSGLPAGATASFTPSTVAVGVEATPVVMTVQTASAVAHNRNDGSPFGRGIVLALLFLPFAARRRVREKLTSRMLLLALLMAGLTATLTGCGSQNGFLLQSPQTYTLTVTATSGTLQHSQTVTLIVQ